MSKWWNSWKSGFAFFLRPRVSVTWLVWSVADPGHQSHRGRLHEEDLGAQPTGGSASDASADFGPHIECHIRITPSHTLHIARLRWGHLLLQLVVLCLNNGFNIIKPWAKVANCFIIFEPFVSISVFFFVNLTSTWCQGPPAIASFSRKTYRYRLIIDPCRPYKIASEDYKRPLSKMSGQDPSRSLRKFFVQDPPRRFENKIPVEECFARAMKEISTDSCRRLQSDDILSTNVFQFLFFCSRSIAVTQWVGQVWSLVLTCRRPLQPYRPYLSSSKRISTAQTCTKLWAQASVLPRCFLASVRCFFVDFWTCAKPVVFRFAKLSHVSQ